MASPKRSPSDPCQETARKRFTRSQSLCVGPFHLDSPPRHHRSHSNPQDPHIRAKCGPRNGTRVHRRSFGSTTQTPDSNITESFEQAVVEQSGLPELNGSTPRSFLPTNASPCPRGPAYVSTHATTPCSVLLKGTRTGTNCLGMKGAPQQAPRFPVTSVTSVVSVVRISLAEVGRLVGVCIYTAARESTSRSAQRLVSFARGDRAGKKKAVPRRTGGPLPVVVSESTGKDPRQA
jgi:hypothetical protein